MSVICAFGMQWGDEGKGRIVDLLAAKTDVVVRYQGGANAGHTVIVGDEKYVLHMLPSGVIQPSTINVIANGVVIDPWVLMEEVDGLAERAIALDGRLLVSDRAHVVLPYHRLMDQAMEKLRGDAAIGTTSRGIGPTYGDKSMRDGLRVADLLALTDCADRLIGNVVARNEILERAGLGLLDPDAVLTEAQAVAERLRPYVTDTTAWLLDAWEGGRNILLEGAQGYGLDLDHGTYPFVTSSNTGSAAVGPGTGLPPKAIDRVLGIVKAYTTRVGAGPFPTHDRGAAGRHLAEVGRELGATTGRPRQCGWFDGVLARRAVRSQGVDGIALMKLDVLSGLERLQVGTAYELDGRRLDAPPALAADWERCRPVYETFDGWSADVTGVRRFDDLPAEARAYVRALQDLLRVPVEMISVGAERACVIETVRGVPVSA
jgi:adenylosuccinate synthase